MRAAARAASLAASAFAASAYAAPERIVSLSGDITEIVYECSAGARLVGVDSTSLYPPEATSLPQVGYVRNLNAEGVLALGPDLVLGTTEAGPPEVVAQLREAGVAMRLVADDSDLASAERKIAAVAEVLETPACAERLLANLRARLDGIEARLADAADGERPRVLFVLNIAAGGPPLAGGADTGADAIIRLAGGTNAAASFDGYKTMAPEAIVASAPDVVLMFEDRLAALGGPEGLAALPGLATTPAARAGRIHGMDGLLLLGFGPRVGEAAWQLTHLLYPDASAR